MATKPGAGGIIGVALILGIATAVLIYFQFQRLEAKSKKNWLPVVVALQDIPPRTKVTREMIELSRFPKELIAENAVTQIEQAENRMATKAISAKEQIRVGDLVQEGQLPTLAVEIPEGMRAVAIGAGEVMAVGTAVKPRDRVDIMATYHDPRTRQELTKMILQNVMVLAVNRGQTDAQGKEGANSSMTLLVKPEEAELLAAADRAGALRVTLRPVKDERVVVSSGATSADFAGRRILEETMPTDTNQAPTIVFSPQPRRNEITIIRATAEQTVSP